VRIPSLQPNETFLLTEKDPGNNFVALNAQGSGGECKPGDAPMIDEPMVFQLKALPPAYGPSASVKAADVSKLPLTGVEPWPLVPGELAAIQGGGLAAGDGAQVVIGGVAVDQAAWLGSCVIVKVPDLPAGLHDVAVHRDGHTSQIRVQVK